MFIPSPRAPAWTERNIKRGRLDEQRFGADHPKWRHSNNQSGDAAGDRHLREDQRAIPDSEHQQSANAGGFQLTAARQWQPACKCEEHQKAAGDEISDRDQLERRECLKRHPDSQVSGAPKQAHRSQGQVGLEEGMALQ